MSDTPIEQERLYWTIPPREEILALARRVAIESCPLPPTGTPRADIEDGDFDSSSYVLGPLAAIRAGLELAAQWHHRRQCETPDAFEAEFHEVSAKHIRAIAAHSEQSNV